MYTRQFWSDLPAETTPISAMRLNHMEVGIESAQTATRSVTEFGAIGDGVADETAAFNAAIAAANALGGSDREGVKGVTILIPDGRYRLPTSLNPITVSAVSFKGSSREGTVLLLSATGAAFTFGDATRARLPLGFSLSSMRLEYPADPAAGACVLKVEYGFETIIDDIQTVRIRTLVQAGVSSANFAGSVTIRNVRGSSANVAGPFVDLRYGAGLNIEGCAMFVRGVIPPVHPASMTTVPNVNVVNAIGAHWDTVMIANSIFERYDYGIAAVSTSGTIIQNVFVDNCIFDYVKTSGLYMEAQSGGIISTFHVKNTWFAAWEGNAIYCGGAGYNDFHDIDAVCAIAGLSSLNYSVPGARNNVFKLTVASNNRLGTAAAAINVAPGSKGFTLMGCKGNEDNGAGTWRNNIGLLIGADCDNYLVSNNTITGASAGYSLVANTGNSTARRVAGNSPASYAGTAAITMPASNNNWTNTSATVSEVFIYSGTVTGIYKNGVQIVGMTSGHIMLNPGETFAVTYSSVPFATRFVQS